MGNLAYTVALYSLTASRLCACLGWACHGGPLWRISAVVLGQPDLLGLHAFTGLPQAADQLLKGAFPVGRYRVRLVFSVSLLAAGSVLQLELRGARLEVGVIDIGFLPGLCRLDVFCALVRSRLVSHVQCCPCRRGRA